MARAAIRPPRWLRQGGPPDGVPTPEDLGSDLVLPVDTATKPLSKHVLGKESRSGASPTAMMTVSAGRFRVGQLDPRR
jgi:hypothetical protein